MNGQGPLGAGLSVIEWIAGLVIAGFGAVAAYIVGQMGKADSRFLELEEKVSMIAERVEETATAGDDKIWEALGKLQQDFHDHRVSVATNMLSKDEFYRADAENRRSREAMKTDILTAIRETRSAHP